MINHRYQIIAYRDVYSIHVNSHIDVELKIDTKYEGKITVNKFIN